MSEYELIKNEEIQNRIYTLRDVQAMLDRDLAIFYGVKPIRLREQVKRNIKRFPSDFMFQLTEEEVDLMVSQNAIPSRQHLGGSLPFVFTEQGIDDKKVLGKNGLPSQSLRKRLSGLWKDWRGNEWRDIGYILDKLDKTAGVNSRELWIATTQTR
ncbi:MAG: ORF6N domain-containing protein [Desulfobacterales bacterium]|uniref:ORF6N domain-containing protein n=1 Tax=Candidatus Desulfaltia bathyphila TaxID=2841697 RepID=A0A8J6N4S6_9BACT|nr:ORF6N domain-containing protein [Candidatus Desulfaltia bathyphila]MBL7195414.1 ORF6N domain-containing protein [Desulfobacterales bacterium]MBL7208405.1 ORF6N domain-containing protein [Desulfobacterales bacterium]